MDLNKSLEFFNPNKVKKRCHIIGCGAIGSSVAELLVRQGVDTLTLWDFDYVEPHNIVNQMYVEKDIAKAKTDALEEHLKKINPAVKIKKEEEYTNQILEGFVFMCVDSVEVRKKIVKENFGNPNIKVMFDFRMTLLEGQHYAAEWNDYKQRKSLLDSLDFTDEEAKENTPVSACGFELSVAPTVRIITALGVANFTNYVNEKPLQKLIVSNPYSFNFLNV